MPRLCRVVVVLTSIALCGLASPLSPQAPQYRVADSIIVGHTGGDFYTLDARQRRLYGAGRNVVDIDAKKIIVRIADTSAGGGFVIAPDLGRGLVRYGTVFASQQEASLAT